MNIPTEISDLKFLYANLPLFPPTVEYHNKLLPTG